MVEITKIERKIMDSLHAPWRTTYVHEVHKSLEDKECVFCFQVHEGQDDKNMILYRGDGCFIMMNKFPYNGGHLLVLPYDHTPTLHNLSAETRAELMELTTLSDVVLEKVLGNHGSNIGLNKGRAGGAGIPEHLHIHVVPRWPGDTNFLPIIADVKQVSVDLYDIFNRLKGEFSKLK